MMKRLLALASILLLSAGAGMAQPVAAGAVNAASFAAPELPNGKLPQGGIFNVFGSNIGPGALATIGPFPLPTEVGGTSVQVTVGGTTVQCIMIFSLSTQIAAILPSRTPAGMGTLTVTFGGQTSAPLAIEVVPHSFGVFAINQAGSGPGVVTDAGFIPNTLTHSAMPGSPWIIWGTGLGPVSGDEAAKRPTAFDMLDLDVSVLVGGVPAAIFYRGRSGCCAGLDQIVFFIPEGVTGCYVPIVVIVEGVPSNYTTISISESGAVCSDEVDGLTAAEISAAQSNGRFRLGTVTLSRVRLLFPNPLPGPSLEFVSENASASFGDFEINRFLASQGLGRISTFGSCVVFQFRGTDAQIVDPVLPTPLDAGPALTLMGPQGTTALTPIGLGSYFADLGSSFPFLRAALKGAPPEGAEQSLPVVPLTGSYDVNNGGGGADVGPFTAHLEVPEPLVWQNEPDITSVMRSGDLRVTWTGGGADTSTQIFGFSAAQVTGEEFLGALFFCREQAAAGFFDVPAAVLSSLPVSVLTEGIPAGLLGVGDLSHGTRFSASGLDAGFFSHSSMTMKTVGYE